jgi:DNA-binding MurR/RpiR family transcriptional regulator
MKSPLLAPATFSYRILRYLADNYISVRELAVETGTSETSIVKLIRGEGGHPKVKMTINKYLLEREHK